MSQGDVKQPVYYPVNRTLFIVNIPIDTTENQLKLLFRRCGSIERVYFHRDTSPHATAGGGSGSVSHTLNRTAHIVFEDETGVDRALEMKAHERVWNAPQRDHGEAFDDEEEDDEDHHNTSDGMKPWCPGGKETVRFGLASECTDCP